MKGLLAAALGATLSATSFVLALLGTASPAAAQSLEIADGTAAKVEVLTVHATVDEGVALVDLDQTFRNPTDRALEGVWTIRLPDDAVVHTFSMWMDGREKQGRVLEAAQARQVYDSIVRRKKDPALLEETGHRTFRVSVFPIPPRDTVRVRLRYAQVVPDDLGLHELTVPMPATAAEIAVIDLSADVRSSQGLSVLDAPGTAGARVERTEKGGTVRWSAERTHAQGPFTVRFAPGGEGFTLSLATHRDPGADDGFFLARIVPHLPTPPDLPRDVVFVVDRSGSMEGRKIEQARAALLRGLATLRPEDRFALVSFATDVTTLGAADGDGNGGLLPADDAHLTRARETASALDASGGTNIAGALDVAASLRGAADARRLFVVVLLTDGDPTIGLTDPAAIVAAWRNRCDAASAAAVTASAGGASGAPAVGPAAPAAQRSDVRLFALGVGADVKDFLLTRLARGSRGAAEYVRDDAALEVKLSALFEHVRTPLLVDPEIVVRGVETSSVEPRPLPDVFRGGAVVLAGRYRGGGPAEVVLRGRSGTTPVEFHYPVVFPTEPVARPHVAQLWARARIDRLLEDLRNAGTVVPEVRREIVDLGVRHQVVSPYTSFLVVEDGVRIPDDRDQARVPDAPQPDTRTAGGAPLSGGGGATSGGAGRPLPYDPSMPVGSSAHALGSRGGAGASTRTVDPDAPWGASGLVPTDSREPSDPPPAPEGGGPGTPGGEDPGGPTTGGGDVGGPTTGGGGGATTGGAGRKLSVRPAPDYSHWTFWWTYESEGLLAACEAPVAPRFDRALLDAQVLPALRAAARDEQEHWYVRANAIEALARLRDPDPATADLVAKLQDGTLAANKVLVERALLVPVWTDDHGAATRARLLGAVARPGGASYARTNAAVALGLLGDTDGGRVTQALVAAAVAKPTDESTRPACCLALGLLGDPSAIAPLEALLAGAETSDVERAWIVGALGRLGAAAGKDGADEVAARLVALAGSDSVSRPARRAVPRALARLFPVVPDAARERIVDALNAIARTGDDASARNEAVLALGRVAGEASCPGARADEIVLELTVSALKAPSADADPLHDFARIALGFAARGPARKAALTALSDATSWRDPATQGAFATAWFLAGSEHADGAFETLAVGRWAGPALQGHATLLLAAVGSPDAPAIVRRNLTAGTDRSLTRDAARAAALCGDAGSEDALLALLRSGEESQQILRATAVALGRVADDGAVSEILKVLRDERTYPDLTRGMAAIALGRLGASGQGPLVRIFDGFPYRAYVPSLLELQYVAGGRL